MVLAAACVALLQSPTLPLVDPECKVVEEVPTHSDLLYLEFLTVVEKGED
jgi:hypothetical protein